MVLRFENLQRDFSALLDRLGLTQIRPLPVVNKTQYAFNETKGKSISLSETAIRPFVPFMNEWGYSTEVSREYHIDWRLALSYELAKRLRLMHALTLNRMESSVARKVRTLFE